ncbi:hypothetical protein DOY81_003243 [Sarcophaga bullata]|nr:hypothetical protein DOY81_003243 [Sarcophaga bullata]
MESVPALMASLTTKTKFDTGYMVYIITCIAINNLMDSLYTGISIRNALMLSQMLVALQLYKDEKENGISNIHNNVNNLGLNEEYKTTTKIIIANTKPVVKALTTTTTLRPTTTDNITASPSLSQFRIAVPVHPPVVMRDNTPLYYNNRFLQIPSGYLSYPRPATMPFPSISQHLQPSRSNLVRYSIFYDFPVYKKQIRVETHPYK